MKNQMVRTHFVQPWVEALEPRLLLSAAITDTILAGDPHELFSPPRVLPDSPDLVMAPAASTETHEATDQPVAAATSAPGYCPSVGGSQSYEYIGSVDVARHGNSMIVTVIIAIANPTGCVSGQPCPEYDSSPEYVNAWVDWDGNGVWESSERVMDKALTGYQAINYHGSMSTSTIVSIPDYAVGSSWMRVNLGWGYDPNDPCTYSWTWGDVEDQQVELRRTLDDLGVTGGLAQYQGDAQDIVFRRGQDSPVFQVCASLFDGDAVQVDVIDDGSAIATINASWDSVTQKYVASWDWSSSSWGTVPGNVPVGEYTVQARIVDEAGSTVETSEERTFYAIFDTPSSLGVSERAAYLYDDAGIRDEVGVWFAPIMDYSTGWWSTEQWHGGDEALRYMLTPFDFGVFSRAIAKVDGVTSPVSAFEELTRYVATNWSYALSGQGEDPATGEYEVSYLLGRASAQCADMANALTAFLRGAGIASRPVAIDANQKAMEAFGPNSWRFHTWTEAYVASQWMVTDPHDHLMGYSPVSQRDYGTSGNWAYIKKVNDVILCASPSFQNSELNDGSADLKFTFNPSDPTNYSDGVSVPAYPFDHQKSWVTDQSYVYWGKQSYDPRDLTDPPTMFEVSLTTDSPRYAAGEEMTIKAMLSNNDTVAADVPLSIEIVEVLTPDASVPTEHVVATISDIVHLAPGEEREWSTMGVIPASIDARHLYYLRGTFGDGMGAAFFDVKLALDAVTSVPGTMLEGETYALSIQFTNPTAVHFDNVAVSFLAPPDMLSLAGPSDVYIGDLAPGETRTAVWTATVVGPSLGDMEFVVTSDNAGSDSIPVYSEVMLPAHLDVVDGYVYASAAPGEPVPVSFVVRNTGGTTADGVTVHLHLPGGASANISDWDVGQLSPGTEVTLSSSVTLGDVADLPLNVQASDTSAWGVATGVVWIDFVTAGNASFSDTYGEAVTDTNGNGRYESLDLVIGVDAVVAGTYSVEGDLCDRCGGLVATTNATVGLPGGSQMLALSFPGERIWTNAVDGPFELRNLRLLDVNGSVVDVRNIAYTTSAYLACEFEQPLIALTGGYWDCGRDYDGDSLADALVIEVSVLPRDDGWVFLRARLTDDAGVTIGWSESSEFLAGGQPAMLDLVFDKETIHSHGVDGPYDLRDVYAYHAGDPTVPDYEAIAHTTASYPVIEFGDLQNVDGLVSIECGRLGFDRRTGEVFASVTVENTSESPLGPKARIVITTISNPSITVSNTHAMTACGDPYICLSCLLGDSYLDPGERVTVPLRFCNPQGVRFAFAAEIQGIVSTGYPEVSQGLGLAGQAEAVLFGETNGDGTVDVLDMNNVLNQLGESGFGVSGDANGDGVVDMNDLNEVFNHLGTSISAANESFVAGSQPQSQVAQPNSNDVGAAAVVQADSLVTLSQPLALVYQPGMGTPAATETVVSSSLPVLESSILTEMTPATPATTDSIDLSPDPAIITQSDETSPVDDSQLVDDLLAGPLSADALVLQLS